MHPQTPLGLWLAGIGTAQMLVEAQTTATLRILGMAGLWPVSRTEGMRMLTEKPGALVEAAGAATTAMMTGKRPDQVMAAALQPIRKKTRANSRRLSKGRRR